MSITSPASSTPIHSRTRTMSNSFTDDAFPRPVGCGRGRILDAIMANQTAGGGKTSHTPSPVKRPRQLSSRSSPGSPKDIQCNCNRSIKYIICRACGHVFQGRMRKECPQHDNWIHLMDLDSCPKCHANKLCEFDGASNQRD